MDPPCAQSHACLPLHLGAAIINGSLSGDRETLVAIALEIVVKQLADSGIVAPGKLENFVPPKAHPKDAEELVTELVKNNHLTAFQAQQVGMGKAKALILGNYTILDKIGAVAWGRCSRPSIDGCTASWRSRCCHRP